MVATSDVERWGQLGCDAAVVLGTNPEVVSWRLGEGACQRLADPRFARFFDGQDRTLSE